MVDEDSSTTGCGVDPELSKVDVVNSMLVVRNGVELISTVTGFKSVATGSVDLEGECVESAVGNI